MNTPTDRDDGFDAALRARRRLVPRFDDADDASPSPELDRLVLSRARDALRTGTAPALPDGRERHYRGPRWAVPLALVATVLLSFMLVLQVDPGDDDAMLAPGDPMPAAPATEAADDGAPAAARAQAGAATESYAAAEVHATPSAADANDPAAWLRRIERLQRDGELDAARKELAAFRRRFPDHRLPATLEPLRGEATR